MRTSGDWVRVPILWEEAGSTWGYWSSLTDDRMFGFAEGKVLDWSKASIKVPLWHKILIGCTSIDPGAWYTENISIYAMRW